MDAIISQLEQDYYSEMKCSALLRKTLKVATVLKDDEMIHFCQREIKGFKDNPIDFPDYRYGHFSYYTEIFGRRFPLIIPQNLKDRFKIFYETLAIKQPISELEEKLNENFDEYQIQISDSLKFRIRSALSLPDDCVLIPYISKSYFKEFIDHIREFIGKWLANVRENKKNDNGSFVFYNYGIIRDSNIVNSSDNSNIIVEKAFSKEFAQYKDFIKMGLHDTNIPKEKQECMLTLFTQLQKAVNEKTKDDGLKICDLIRAILIGVVGNVFTDGFSYLISFVVSYFHNLF